MICTCDDWKPEIDKINGFIVVASIRASQDLYDGKLMVYCPWCGKMLIENEEDRDA